MFASSESQQLKRFPQKTEDSTDYIIVVATYGVLMPFSPMRSADIWFPSRVGWWLPMALGALYGYLIANYGALGWDPWGAVWCL